LSVSWGESRFALALPFLSGQIAATPGSEDVPKDVAGQAKLATASLAAALKELKASAQDIAMLRVYVVDATKEAFQQAVTPLRELLGDPQHSEGRFGTQPGLNELMGRIQDDFPLVSPLVYSSMSLGDL
jgi:enamine deaminase RidA (YjgF/YER057c/UK114 family)